MREIESKIPDFLIELIKNPESFQKDNGKPPFTFQQLKEINKLVINHLKKIPIVVVLSDIFKDTLIIGDTHGFLDSTLRIIHSFLEDKVESLLFLGDYVDRGPYSLVNFILILALSLAWPDRVIILRGNHEDLRLNYVYGFKKELLTYYPNVKEYKEVEKLIDQIYDYLSLAAITPQKSIALHAGIPNGIESIKDLEIIPKPHGALLGIAEPDVRIKAYEAFLQIRWNDPREDQSERFKKSHRGPNLYLFNEEVVKDFLEKSGAKRIIRAHESSKGGFKNLFNGKLIHIFSTEPYFGKAPQAFVIHEQSDGKTFLRDLVFNIVKEI